jgi:hypothetical protein
MPEIIDGLIAEHIDRIGARELYLNDPLYHSQAHWMREVLRVIEIAMEDNGIAYLHRERVLRAALHVGMPSAENAAERLHQATDPTAAGRTVLPAEWFWPIRTS